MGILAWVLLAIPLQEAPIGPPLPPELRAEATVTPPPVVATPQAAPAVEPPAPKILPREQEPLVRPVTDRADAGPNLWGFLFWSLVVMGLLVGTFMLLRRFGRGSRFLAGGGVIRVLARKPLGPRQEVFLIEAGTKIFLVGSTRDRLATLGEFSNPDDVAVLRAHTPGRKEETAASTFRNSLKEGLREEEKPSGHGAFDGMAEQLADLRRTVRAWRA